MPQTYTVRDPETNRTVTFAWNGETPPTDSDMAEVFAAAGPASAQSTVKPVSVDEPGDYWGGVRKGAVEGMVGGRKGFEQGVRDVVLHPVDTAVGIGRSAAGAIADTAEGIGNLIYQPREAIRSSAEGIKSIPGKVAGAVESWMREAATDPEGFGRSVGQATAITGGSMALGGGLRILPKPIARTVGAFAKDIGKEARFPARLVGFHQVVSGNPAGLATVMLPGALEKGGAKLERWGTAAGAAASTLPARVAAIRNSLATGALTPEKAMVEVRALQSELAPRIAGSQLPGDAAAALREQKILDALQSHVSKAVKAPAGGLSATDQALLDKILARNASPTAGKAATDPRTIATTPPAVRVGVTPAAAVTDPGMAKWISSGGTAESYAEYLAKREAIAQARGRQGGLTPQQQTAQLQMEQRMEMQARKFAEKQAAERTAAGEIETTRAGLEQQAPTVTETIKAGRASQTTRWKPGESPARQAELQKKLGGTQEATPATEPEARPPVQKKLNPEPEAVRTPTFVSLQEWTDLGGTPSGYKSALAKAEAVNVGAPSPHRAYKPRVFESEAAAKAWDIEQARILEEARIRGLANAARQPMSDAELSLEAEMEQRGLPAATRELIRRQVRSR